MNRLKHLAVFAALIVGGWFTLPAEAQTRIVRGWQTIATTLLFVPDNTNDIGSASFRPRDLNLGRNLTVGGVLSSVNGVTATGNGVPIIVAQGRSIAQTGAVASVVTYTPTADASFIVSVNVLVTTATSHTFSVQISYTDEGNTARTVTMNLNAPSGSFVTSITNTAGAIPYEGVLLQIRAKANTAVTVLTAGTFTTVTYNVEATIQRI